MNTKYKFTRRLVAALIAAVGMTALATAPASAAPANCDSGAMCVWRDSDYKTAGYSVLNFQFQYYYTDFGYKWWWQSGTATTVDDSTTSVYNNGNVQSAALFDGTNGNGWGVLWAKKTGTSQLSSFNDRASSGYFCGYTAWC